MNKARVLALVGIFISVATLSLPLRGGIQPKEYPDHQSGEMSTSCPGTGTCSRILYPGEFYCGFCLFLGCGCICNPADIRAEYQQGNCYMVTNSFGETFADCRDYHATSYLWFGGNVCITWHG